MRTVLKVLLAAFAVVSIAFCAGCREMDMNYKGKIADVLYVVYDLGDVPVADVFLEIVSAPKVGDLSEGEYVLFNSLQREITICVGDMLCFSVVSLKDCEKEIVGGVAIERIVEIDIC